MDFPIKLRNKSFPDKHFAIATSFSLTTNKREVHMERLFQYLPHLGGFLEKYGAEFGVVLLIIVALIWFALRSKIRISLKFDYDPKTEK